MRPCCTHDMRSALPAAQVPNAALWLHLPRVMLWLQIRSREEKHPNLLARSRRSKRTATNMKKNLRQPSHIRCAVRKTSPHRSCIPILARHYFLRQICASKDSFELVFHLMSPQNETNSSSLPSPVGYTALSTLLQLRIYFQPRCFLSVFL